MISTLQKIKCWDGEVNIKLWKDQVQDNFNS